MTLVLLDAAVIATALLLHSPGFETGLIAGALPTLSSAVVGLAFLLDGGALLIAGDLGESSTRDELSRARERGHVWHVVNNVERGGRDVDHVVITPAGVLAVETKWRIRDADERWLDQATTSALRAARETRLLLLSVHVGHRCEPRPVLVVWGGAQRDLPPHSIVNEVDVLRGDAVAAWLETCSRGPLPEDQAETLARRLEELRDSQIRTPAAGSLT